MGNTSIYKSLAHYYDFIYSWKDYKDESAKISSLIKKFKKTKGNDMLELACGTGKHAKYLSKNFKIVATDLNNEMLEIARKNVKKVKFVQADMITLSLNKKFDVIICLFSSIGYLKSYKNLQKTINNAAKHLKNGGILIIEPWFTKEKFIENSLHMDVYDGPDLKISRICNSTSKGIVSVLDMQYLIGETGRAIKSYVDRHELAMFPYEKFLKYYEAAGLSCIISKEGLAKDKSLIIGVKKW